MKYLIIISISLYLLNSFTYAQSEELLKEEINVHPDFGLTFEEFLEKYHYPLETYKLTTEDGYILTLHRIPHGRNEEIGESQKPAIFFMHCYLCSSMQLVNMGPNRSLALQLADRGYDIWLPNMRGNLFSRNHTTLDPDDLINGTFWDFSFHEVGYYDIPVAIDFVLNKTKLEKVTYIGFSEGTTASFVLTSTRPEYNKKINLIVNMAPVAYMQNITSPITKILKPYELLISVFLDKMHLRDLPYTEIMGQIGLQFCSDESEFQVLCTDIFFLITGFDEVELNKTLLPLFMSSFPEGGSIKTLLHYLQLVETEYFRQYDYGIAKNLEIYGNMTPPSYNLSLVTAPVALYYGANDFLSSVPDTERLASTLPNLAKKKLIDHPKFNHFDYLIATHINELVYNDIMDLINKFNKK